MSARKPLKTGPTEGEVRLTFDMPEDLRRRLKVVAAENSKLMKELILEWIRAGVEALEKKRK